VSRPKKRGRRGAGADPRICSVYFVVARDYPYTTVPNQVHRLHRAQTLHDRIHYDARMGEHDLEKRESEFDSFRSWFCEESYC